MFIDVVETGWKRFLDRLKQLWGKSGRSDLPAGTASATDAHETRTPGVFGDIPAPSPGGP